MQRASRYRMAMGSVAGAILIVAVGGCVELVRRQSSMEDFVCLFTIPFLLALAGCRTSGRGPLRWVNWVVWSASVGMLTCFLVFGLWVDEPNGAWSTVLGVTGSVAAVYLGFGLILWPPGNRSPAGRVSRWVAMALATAATAGFIYVLNGPGMLMSSLGVPETLYLGGPLILLGGVLAALPFIDGAGAVDSETLASPIRVQLTCPRCGSRQSLKAGGDACAGCGLAVAIEVQPPRCRCGYLLVGIGSDACPECGRDARGKSWPIPMEKVLT